MLILNDWHPDMYEFIDAKLDRILQIGDGNFLRAFVDWMVDVANGAGLMNGEVIMAQPLERGVAELMKAQDQLFTVLLRGVQNGQPVQTGSDAPKATQ